MRFRSKRMIEYEYAAYEDEMIRYANHLLNETQLGIDAVRARFAEMFGDENSYFLEEMLDEQQLI